MIIETVRDIGELGRLYLGRFGSDPRKRVEFVDTIEPGIPREEKWVLMVSTQFGCPIGCSFCDAGAVGFSGNLSAEQILAQIDSVLRSRPELDAGTHPKLKIHFARMGEPALNPEVLTAMERLGERLPSGGLMPSLSTVAPRSRKVREFFDGLLRVKERRFRGGRLQLQFSLHGTTPEERDRIVPVPKWTLAEIAAYGKRFVRPGDRRITLNFALAPVARLDDRTVADHFSPERFLIKITPVNATERARETGAANPWFEAPDSLRSDASRLEARGFRVILSPSQPEEVEAGTSCGQLWSSMMLRRARRPASDPAEARMRDAVRFERRVFALNPAKAGLLIVDMQNHFLDREGPSYVPGAESALENALRLAAAFRAAGKEPFFTRHSYFEPERDGGRMLEWWRSVCLETGKGARHPAAFRARAGRCFRKTRYNAFTNPRLEPALRAAGVEDLVLAGIATNLCVESTARAAFDLGFRVFTAVDATAARSEELHRGSLRAMADGFACLRTTGEIEGELGAIPSRQAAACHERPPRSRPPFLPSGREPGSSPQ
ncbi:MAG: hypothetical protein CO113_19490 [Elusimicrobia bacterium CG_4_9_14_3_um_filter_62_55]|nr:MAG: hypothetical protein COR54_09470 [Elusimicrobia bacterium CG22_combo_CG10-13_8_21_14_all_63_91]PJA14856.1 MAG: hypothetical protein COX66_11615 [Elusimicrobia bacterium CG_4_10_14_0_2_um_filter_63_34]PJB23102.1 MAG: hypothetical protein CO113_19490 [Elusimicrobia bacterium CG_4_9_14_3_um_filter_62_55]